MGHVVFLLEEGSMKTLLDGLLPRMYPKLSFTCIPHEGKNDLEKSIPRKLRAWSRDKVQFVVVRDQDLGDCHALKARLVTLCRDAGRGDTLVRIVCRTLESWYLGEPDALADAYKRESLRNIGAKSKFRNPDIVDNACAELKRLVPEFQKVSGARQMAALLSREGNRSKSFHVLLMGVEHLLQGTNQ